MSKLKYSYQGEKKGTARVMGKELEISTKRAYEVANAIRGEKMKRAKSFLQNVLDGKEAVPYKRYNKCVPHRKGIQSGRYPENASREFLNLLDELEANAHSQGLNEDLMIEHVATHDAGDSRGSYKGSPQNTSLTHVEIVAKEVVEKQEKEEKKEEKEQKKPKKKKSKEKKSKKSKKKKKKEAKDLSDKSYRELQKMAKKHDIKANQKKEEIIEELKKKSKSKNKEDKE